ncbi:hypothetical protein DOJK_01554 [Patescibacteria group bacterium]|nr:hypothetical protein DOJK_01554 [Patescibacteria group bacterium]
MRDEKLFGYSDNSSIHLAQYTHYKLWHNHYSANFPINTYALNSAIMTHLILMMRLIKTIL